MAGVETAGLGAAQLSRRRRGKEPVVGCPCVGQVVLLRQRRRPREVDNVSDDHTVGSESRSSLNERLAFVVARHQFFSYMPG